MDVFPRPELFDFHGVCMTHYFTDNWEKVQNFQARPDYILIDSYTKAGSTWVSYILDLLCYDQTSIPLYERVPNLEIAIHSLQLGLGSSQVIKGTEMADNLSIFPRLIKTHLPVQFLKDTGREIDKLCCFLGLSPSAEKKERITGSVQFDVMKKNTVVNFSTLQLMDFKKSSFIRKGKVGDWRNHFTVAQDEKFDADYKQKMKNPTLQFCTEV
ncbi:hypothetical protein EPR50_G00111340 [Perca flavescens]|uniref:Sulfotransferase n=2 Tax=Perca flavescens TaxID=8167 RepID=A0A484CY32_PERFV|nr:cytosolic sulfotransferase 2-like isoform X2 [Perca flavescens]XP_028446071.1 cytosolic sulfotransferase 2-like isoform X2 [Perca flavescens]TDH07906.1 hypothetical protein EPR50_G00111340 [Perca flavescens]